MSSLMEPGRPASAKRNRGCAREQKKLARRWNRLTPWCVSNDGWREAYVSTQGDFDEFYTASRLRLLRQLTIMTGDPEQAADVLQEAYARAWQRWGRVSRLDNPVAWVRTVAWRVAISQHRRSLVAADRLRRFRASEVDRVEGSEERVDLLRALSALSAEHRRTVVLHEMAGLSVAEIAVETGVPAGTVKSRLWRARAALGAALGREYLVEGSANPATEGNLS
jgi:RNA polymerase sigma-70 factor, ECF subfamily